MTAAVTALRAAARLDGPERRRFVLSVALAAGAVGAACALLATSGYLISRAAQRPPVLLLAATIVAVRAFALVRAGLRYGERLTSHDVALRQLAAIRTRLYRRLAPLVPGDLHGTDRGELLARFVGDVDQLQHLHPRALTPPLVAAATVAGAGAAAAIMLPAAGAVLAAALLASAAVSIGVTAWATHAGARAEAAERAGLTSRLVEAFEGSAELAVAGRAGDHLAGIDSSSARLAAIQRRYAYAGAAATAAGSLLAGAGLLGVLAVGIGAAHGGTLPGVLLAALALLAIAAVEGIVPLGPAARHLHACAVAAGRVEAICRPEPSVADPGCPVPLPGAGALSVEGAWVRYGDDEPWALRGVDLHVAPGEHVAIVGPSGAGKTTLAHLLVRFRDPDAGRVRISGTDLRDLRQADVRAAVALVDQDAHLFTTTLRENVRLARPDASEEEIADAIARAGLGSWLSGLPDGLDTMVGEAGALVSGGERRRIALSRALLSRARFLVADEPTAHLDAAGARRMLVAVAAGAGDRGLVVITHVHSGLEAFDRVVVLADGAVCAAGPG